MLDSSWPGSADPAGWHGSGSGSRSHCTGLALLGLQSRGTRSSLGPSLVVSPSLPATRISPWPRCIPLPDLPGPRLGAPDLQDSTFNPHHSAHQSAFWLFHGTRTMLPPQF